MKHLEICSPIPYKKLQGIVVAVLQDRCQILILTFS